MPHPTEPGEPAPAHAVDRTVDELHSVEAIRRVLYLYARAVDRCDLDLLRQAYHPDATDIHGNSFAGSGWRFAEWLVGWTAALPPSRHTVTNVVIDLDGDRALVESQYDAVQWYPLDDDRWLERRSLGRYLDVFERRAGQWRIQHRRAVPDTSRATVVDAELMRRAPVDDARPPIDTALVSGHAPDDPIYLGFGLADLAVVPFEANSPAETARRQFTGR